MEENITSNVTICDTGMYKVRITVTPILYLTFIPKKIRTHQNNKFCIWFLGTLTLSTLSQSKPAEVVLIAIVGSVVLIVVNAYMSIELTLISDSVIKADSVRI